MKQNKSSIVIEVGDVLKFNHSKKYNECLMVEILSVSPHIIKESGGKPLSEWHISLSMKIVNEAKHGKFKLHTMAYYQISELARNIQRGSIKIISKLEAVMHGAVFEKPEEDNAER